MPLLLTPDQQKALVRYRLKPRTLKQYYAARALLAMGKGHDPGRVAKAIGKPEPKVMRWVKLFEKKGVVYIKRLGLPRTGKATMTMAEIQAKSPGVESLLRMAKSPSTAGADLDADPADL